MSTTASTRAWSSGASGNDLLVLLALADHAGGEEDPYDFAYPSVARLESMTRLSRRTVQRCLRSLESDGFIRKTGEHAWGRGKVTTQYRIESGVRSTGRQDDAASDDAPGGASPVTPKPSIEPSESSSSTDRARVVVGSLDFGAAGVVVPMEMAVDAEALLAAKRRVDGRIVTADEMVKAAAALAAFNDAGGSGYGLGAHLTPLVGRVRERPSYGAAALVRLVQSAWRIRWWSRTGSRRRPTPAVVFGNANVFEAVVQDAIAEKRGETVEPAARSGRYMRED